MSQDTFVNSKKEIKNTNKKGIFIGGVILSLATSTGLIIHSHQDEPIAAQVYQTTLHHDDFAQNELKMQINEMEKINSYMVKTSLSETHNNDYSNFLNNYFNLWNNNVLSNDKIYKLTLPSNKTVEGEIRDPLNLAVDIKLLNHNHDLLFDSHYRNENECNSIIDYTLNNKESLALNHVKIKSIMLTYGKTNSYFSEKDLTQLSKPKLNQLISAACSLNTPTTYLEPDVQEKINPQQKFINNTHLVIDYEKTIS